MKIASTADTIEGFLYRTAPGGNGCIEWKLCKQSQGYGVANIKYPRKRTIMAHRQSWILHFGLIPEGIFVCHRCDNPPCVNPEHLFLGTQQENLDDMKSKGREPSGERNGQAVLTADIVRSIRREYIPRPQGHFEGLKRGGLMGPQLGSEAYLANKYGISRAQVHRILVGERWAHIK